MITGMCRVASSARSRRSSSKPSVRGIITSVSTTSGARSATAASASSPFAVVRTVHRRPSNRREVRPHVGVVIDDQDVGAHRPGGRLPGPRRVLLPARRFPTGGLRRRDDTALADDAPAPATEPRSPSSASDDSRPGAPAPRRPQEKAPSAPGRDVDWRFPAEAASIPVLRRRLRTLLDDAGVEHDQAYDLLLAACEAATNAFEHAQEPTEPFFDVTVHVGEREVRIAVRDYGQWRERVPSMDRGRGSTLMSAFGVITATPSPTGTTVVIVSPMSGDRPTPATA